MDTLAQNLEYKNHNPSFSKKIGFLMLKLDFKKNFSQLGCVLLNFKVLSTKKIDASGI